MGTGLPSYVFFLLCCYKEQCSHPRYNSGQPNTLPTWYPDGLPLSMLPLPVLDPERPWGGNGCTTCKGFCAGHYRTQLVDVTDPEGLQTSVPPSVTLNRVFDNSNGCINEGEVASIAKCVLLPPEEVKIWFDHLSTVCANRSRGAQKAAETRRQRRDPQLAPKQSQKSGINTKETLTQRRDPQLALKQSQKSGINTKETLTQRRDPQLAPKQSQKYGISTKETLAQRRDPQLAPKQSQKSGINTKETLAQKRDPQLAPNSLRSLESTQRRH